MQVRWVFGPRDGITTIQVQDEWSVWLLVIAPVVWGDPEYQRRLTVKNIKHSWNPLGPRFEKGWIPNLFYSGKIFRRNIHYYNVKYREYLCLYCGRSHNEGCGLYCEDHEKDNDFGVVEYYNSTRFCTHTVQTLKYEKLNLCGICSKMWWEHDDS